MAWDLETPTLVSPVRCSYRVSSPVWAIVSQILLLEGFIFLEQVIDAHTFVRERRERL
jgi:hypothetical protein